MLSHTCQGSNLAAVAAVLAIEPLDTESNSLEESVTRSFDCLTYMDRPVISKVTHTHTVCLLLMGWV
jgi:hypothetical protein